MNYDSVKYLENFIKKYSVVQKLDYLTYHKLLITTSFYKPINLDKIKVVFKPRIALHV